MENIAIRANDIPDPEENYYPCDVCTIAKQWRYGGAGRCHNGCQSMAIETEYATGDPFAPEWQDVDEVTATVDDALRATITRLHDIIDRMAAENTQLRNLALQKWDDEHGVPDCGNEWNYL